MPDVIVIGAGVAGLSAAARLADDGGDVLVLEARPSAGGRAAAYRDPATGERVDNGQHVLLGCYHETLAFLERIGADEGLRRQTGLSVRMIERDGRASVLQCPPLPAPWHLVGGVLAWQALTLAERLSLAGLVPALARAQRALARGDDPGRDARGRSVRAWLEQCGQAPRLSELLWEPLALAALNQSIETADASHFLGVLARAFGPDPADAELIVPARPLDALYVDPAVRFIRARGGDVRTHASARVIVRNGRVEGARVRDEAVAARVVIAAVPWFGLRALFDEPPDALSGVLDAAGRMAASPIVTANLWFDRPVMDEPLVGLPGRAFQWVFDKGLLFGDGTSHLSLVSSGADRLAAGTNDAIVATAIEELGGVFPEVGRATLRRATAVRERMATFSLAPDQPPRPSTRTAIEGLLLAGDWIDTGLPATIESAVLSGRRAAAQAIVT
jgi:squalene-associated FAD-dependent desaturase